MSVTSSGGGAGGPTDATPSEVTAKVERRAATPVAGAVAGILFAVLFGVSVTIISGTMTDSRERRRGVRPGRIAAGALRAAGLWGRY